MQGVANSKVPVLQVVHLAQVVGTAGMFVVGGAVISAVIALSARAGGPWTCGVPLVVATPLRSVLGWRAGVLARARSRRSAATFGGTLSTCEPEATSRSWAGGAGPMTPIRRWRGWRRLGAGERVTDKGVAIGFSRQGEGSECRSRASGSAMALVVGATGRARRFDAPVGAGRHQARVGGRFIDPEGDDYVFEQLGEAAARAGVRLLPGSRSAMSSTTGSNGDRHRDGGQAAGGGGLSSRPAGGSQRSSGLRPRALRLADVDVSLATVVEHMRARRLPALTRRMSPSDARPLLTYLETLSPQQERDLAGARDRLAILAESDARTSP